MSETQAGTQISPESYAVETYRNLLADGRLNPALKFMGDASVARFEATGFPGRSNEMFSYVKTDELASARFDFRYGPKGEADSGLIAENIYEGCGDSVIVLLDGRYSARHSSTETLGDSIRITELDDAVSQVWVKRCLLESVENENDPFALLNGAFAGGGILVEVKPGVKLESPLQILHLTSGGDGPVMTTPRIMLRVGESAHLDLAVKYAGTGENYFVNSITKIMLEVGLQLRVSQFQDEPFGSWHFSKNHVTQKRDSGFSAVTGSMGGRLVRQSHEVDLSEEGARLELDCVSVLNGSEQAHHFANIRHNAPRCFSRQWFRNIVNDSAQTSTNGTVRVMRDAQETVSEQLINNLMLSDNARAFNKPNLMIFADDVKCTHGATISQLEDEQLFYAKARCIPEETARNMLIDSFAMSIIEKVNYGPVLEEMKNRLLGKLGGK